MDIAIPVLEVVVRTTGLEKTERDLEGLGQASDKAAAAAKRTHDAFKQSFDNAQRSATQSAMQSTQAFNALRGSLTGMAQGAFQAIPGFTAFTSVLGNLTVGAPIVVGVLGTLTAFKLGFDALTEPERKAKEELERLTKAANDWFEVEKRGANGELVRQLEAVHGAVTVLADEYERLNRARTDATKPEQQGGATSTSALFNQYAGGVGSSNAFFQQLAGGVGSSNAYFSGIANGANAAAAATALHKEKTVEDALAMKLAVEQARARLETLNREKDEFVDAAAKYIAAREPLIAIARAREDAAGAAKHEAEDIGLSGAALEHNNVMYEAATATRHAWNELMGEQLQRTLANIVAHRDEALAIVQQKEALEHATVATKAFADMQSQLAAIAARNKGITDAQTNATAKKIVEDTTNAIQAQARVVDQSIQGVLELANAFGLVGRTVSDIGRGLSQALTGIGPLRNAIDNLGRSKEAGGTSGFDVALASLPVVGGIASAASALLGAAKAQHDEAEAAKKFYEDFRQSLRDWGSTFGTSVEQALYALEQRRAGAQSTIGALSDKDRLSNAFYGFTSGPNNPVTRASTARDAVDQQTLDELTQKARAQITTDFLESITRAFNETRGPAGAFANALTENTKRYDEARASAEALGVWDAQRATIEATLVTQQTALVAAEQNRVAQINNDLAIREALALGNDAEAEAIRRRAEEEAQLFAAGQDHWTDEQIARLKNIQTLEDQKAALDKATEAAKRNADAQASFIERGLRATGQDDALFAYQQQRERDKIAKDLAAGEINAFTAAMGDWALDAEKWRREQDKAAEAAQKIADAQRDAMNVQRQAVQEQIRGAEQILNTTRSAIDGARAYLDKGKLGSLTPLGPQARYEEARRQYLALGSAADAGDVKAYSQLPDAIEAFRKESRNMFASSSRYAQDFNSSQIYLESLTDKFGVQATVQEQMLAVLQAQLARLQPGALPVDIGKNIPAPTVTTINIPPFAPNPGSPKPTDPIDRFDPYDPTKGRPDWTPTAWSLWDPYMSGIINMAAGVKTVTDGMGNSWNGSGQPNVGTWYDAMGVRNPDFQTPGYARGGDFGGGLMRVGERGEELVATGAARVHTASQLNADVVKEVRALRDDLVKVVRRLEGELVAAADRQTRAITLNGDSARENRRRGIEF